MAFLSQWTISDADRSDCFQEIWKGIIAGLLDFAHDPNRARLSTWLMTMTRNKAVDSIRHRRRHVAASLSAGEGHGLRDPGPDPAAEYERSRRQEHVRRMLVELSEQVSPTNFRIAYLRWIEDLPAAQVAAAVQMTPQQVRMHTHRLKRKARRLLARSMAGDLVDGDLGWLKK
jgi:RNA polymerase sigma factor (sigma-70 family)